MIFLLIQGKIDHGESKKNGFETLGCNLRAAGPKNHEKSQNFKVVISLFSWQILTKSTMRNPKIVVSRLFNLFLELKDYRDLKNGYNYKAIIS